MRQRDDHTKTMHQCIETTAENALRSSLNDIPGWQRGSYGQNKGDRPVC